MSVIIIPRRHYTQPQGRVTVDWSNPLSQGLLLAATPFSEMATQPEIRYGALGAGVRGGVLNRGPITHGVANSTVFILTQVLLPEDGSWWNSSGIIFVDTSTVWPNDRGLRVHVPKTYGVMIVSARDTTGTVYTAEIDVLDGGQTYGGSFSGAATVGADLLVTGFGSGKKWGTSGAMQGRSYNAPAPTYSGPLFGAPITGNGCMDHLSLTLRWGRVCSDEEIFEVERNPWQLFRADPIRIYSLPTGAISINSILASTTLSDTAAATNTLTALLAETVSLLDQLNTGNVFNEAHAAAVTAADSLASAATFSVALAETTTPSDATAAASTFAVSLAEVVTLLDASSNGSLYTEVLTASVALSDALANTVTLTGAVTESLALSDALNALATFQATLSEAVAAGDLVATQADQATLPRKALTARITALSFSARVQATSLSARPQ